jgi:hypothetical protein
MELSLFSKIKKETSSSHESEESEKINMIDLDLRMKYYTGQ